MYNIEIKANINEKSFKKSLAKLIELINFYLIKEDGDENEFANTNGSGRVASQFISEDNELIYTIKMIDKEKKLKPVCKEIKMGGRNPYGLSIGYRSDAEKERLRNEEPEYHHRDKEGESEQKEKEEE